MGRGGIITYITTSDVEEFMGIAYTDLKVNGETMDEGAWIQFVQTYQVPIAEMIHRYCRVPTFDPASSRALVIEYRNGRGSSYDDAPYIRGYSGLAKENEYLETDIMFYLRNLYFTGTLNINGTTVTRAPLLVEEDTADKTATPNWLMRACRSLSVGGDYEVLTTDELTSVRFHNFVPKYGNSNIRFTYYTGYDPASDDFKVIKLQVLRCFKNFVMLKKKTQEPLTIRAQGVRDFTTMMEPFDEAHILGDLEKLALEPYRRFPIPGAMYD
jgi:hypothetical protein